MRASWMELLIGWIVCSLAACLLAACGPGYASVNGDENEPFTSEDALAARADRQRPSFVRIRTIDMDREHEWTLVGRGTPDHPQYDAQSVLGMINDLQPDVLERYVSGDLTRFTSSVPGRPPLSASAFLAASERATRRVAQITPRVSLSDYDDQNPAAFFQMTEDLLHFHAGPRALQHVSLDIWTSFGEAHHWSRDFIVDLFDRLHAQGWAQVGVNLCGSPEGAPLEHLDAWGHADFADVCVSAVTWTPTRQLQTLNGSRSVHRRLLYLDFPSPIDRFIPLPHDRQAAILTDLARDQSVERYTLMYPILQLEPPVEWDSTQVRTSATGPWHGQTLFEVMRDLIRRYNRG